MNEQEIKIIVELHEMMVESYRKIAAKIAERAIRDGFDQAVSVADSPYLSQVHVAWLACLIFEKICPVLTVVSELAKQTGWMELLINRKLEELSVDLEVEHFDELTASIERHLSESATANGLPPCCFVRQISEDR